MHRRPSQLLIALVVALPIVFGACADDATPGDGGGPTTTTGPAPTSGEGGADTEAGDPGGGVGRTESGEDPVSTDSEPTGGSEPSP